MNKFISDTGSTNKSIERCISFFKEKIFSKIDSPANYWVAGGALRDFFSTGYPRRDIDLFFHDQSNFDVIKRELVEYKKTPIVFENANVLSVSFNDHKLDLVKKFFNSPEDTISEFDFTVCSAAVTWDTLYYHKDFFIDLASRKLVINSLPFPLSTLQRLQKYIKMGFTICNGGILAIAEELHKVDIHNIEQNQIEFYPDGTVKFVRFD